MQNNFDAVRLLLALIVVCAHLCVLSGVQAFDAIRPYFSAEFAVKGFFTISGFLVMQSYIRSQNFKEYAEKRGRRIYPAYAATIGLCLVIGCFTSNLNIAEFLTSSHTYKYVVSNLLFANFLAPDLPGVFIENNIQAMNGALWTIKVEVCLYLFIPSLFFAFNRFGKLTSTIICYVCALCWIFYFTQISDARFSDQLAHQFPAQLSYFALGAFFATEPRTKPYLLPLMLVAGIFYWMKLHPILTLVLEPLLFATFVTWSALQTRPIVNTGKYGDFSYGIYLLHFPIIQLLAHVGVYQASPWTWFFLTLLIVVVLAWISWHLIEKPVLKRSSYYVRAENLRKK